MATGSTPSVSNAQSVASSVKLYKPNLNDIGWKYNSVADLKNTKKVICDFCLKPSSGGISRGKQHQMGIGGQVSVCTKTPEDVKLILFEHEEKRLKKAQSISVEVHEDDDVALELQEIAMLVSGKRARSGEGCSTPAAKNKKNTKGPLDNLWYKKAEETIGKGKQTNVKDFSKEAREKVNQYIARFFYLNGIAFNVVKSKSFKLMVEAIGQYGPHLKPPSYHELRNPCLHKELENTHKMLETNKSQAAKYGCSIMSDGWTDTKGRTLINFLVHSPGGMMFVKSIDASKFVKTGKAIFEMLDEFVGEVGESNVVQLVTDNGSNYKMAGRLLQETRPKLFWTPCAAHCLDLMLEDIGKIPRVKRVVGLGISLVGFIYNHSLVLNLLREKAESELIRYGVTRFATTFLTLQRLHNLKQKIRAMFTSQEWSDLKVSKEAKGKKACSTVLLVSFWDDVVFALKAMGPLIKVLRLVDNEKKPAMGFIYQAMIDAKNQIQKNFDDNENKYKPVIEIVEKRWSIQLHHPLHAAGHYLNPRYFYTDPEIENDDELLDGLYKCIERLSASTKIVDAIHGELAKYRDCEGHFKLNEAIRQRDTIAPAEWWKRYGSKTPNLKLLAIKILSLTCSSSGCERNWSTFELIHSKRRNRLEHEMLQKLVFIKYNQTIVERYESDDKIDPVIMDDNLASNEWELGEEGEGEGALDDVVFHDEDLSWLDVDVASGVGEPIVNTRSQAALQKAAAPMPPPRTTPSNSKRKASSSKGKEKEVIEVDEIDPEFVHNWGDEEKEDEEEEIEDVEIEDKEDEDEHMHNPSGGGSDDEDFGDS